MANIAENMVHITRMAMIPGALVSMAVECFFLSLYDDQYQSLRQSKTSGRLRVKTHLAVRYIKWNELS